MVWSLSPEITVKELLDRYPGLFQQFLNMGLLCGGCSAEAYHSLIDVAKEYGYEPQELVRRLERFINEEKRLKEEGLSMVESLAVACGPMDISDPDVMAAMKTLSGYIDITPADFREIYKVAYRMARDRMRTALTAQNVMQSPVYAIKSEMDLIQTAAILSEKKISGAPVVDHSGRVVGVVSEKDFLSEIGVVSTGSFMQVIAHCLQNKGCLVTSMFNRSVTDIMTSPAVTATVDITLADISALFNERKINRLPILDGDGQLIGIVTRSDLVSSYCGMG